MNTLTQLRTSFWECFPEFASQFRKTWRQNQYNATIRTAWVEYVDNMHRNGLISDGLANRATL
jgi:hypothetical protein